MSFHVSGRKPSRPRKELRFPLGYRFLLAGLGAGLAWFGSYSRNPANFGYRNWRGELFYPNSVVPIGAVLMVVSFVPASWIERAANRLFR
jgi:hypothetical protein